MKNRFMKITSVLFLSITMLFSSAALATNVIAEVENDKFIVIHTNDMHGRLNEVPRGKEDNEFGKHTLLARLKYFVETEKPSLVVDGGDAVQGLPISNLNEGKYMLDSMIEIGYTMMTAGNHEFDFGYDRALGIKKYLEDNGQGMQIISSNVQDKDSGELSFKPYDVIETNGKKVGLIGLTTPETIWKTHPNNTVGVEFLEPIDQTKIYIKEIMENHDDIDLFVPVGHLGLDGETPDGWRGDKLAEVMSGYLKEEGIDIPLLMVDGHSHSEVDGGKTFGDNVLYVQTGEHLNNIGHVEIDFEDFSNSKAKLVETKTVQPDNDVFSLGAEDAAAEDFQEIAGEVLLEDLPYSFNGEREYVRTRETNLGNLVADAMLAYGKGLNEQPDLAVMNGGGIRENLLPGQVTKGDAIAVIPFGNIYASINISGQDIVDMFEHSLRAPVQEEDGELLKDELGHYLLGANGGFLQISSTVKLEYNVMNEPGSRVVNIMIDRADGWEELELDETYVLATNDFLAQGGDDYDMLGGDRFEGESLDAVFAQFLNNDLVDWELYKDEYKPVRILQLTEDKSDAVEDTPTDTPADTPTDTPADTPADKDQGDQLPATGIGTGAFMASGMLALAGATTVVYSKYRKAD